MTARAGDHFADYLLLHKVAQGGMGEVFIGRRSGPQGFSRHVVLKRMLPQYLDRPEYVEMFFAEARVASRLHHDRIVQVLEVGEWQGDYYLVMDLVRGINLRQLLDKAQQAGRPIPRAAFCELMAEAADGLAYAHSATDHDGTALNLVHRDINPSNLLVDWDGHLKIIDLGIAKSALARGHTQTGMLKGKYRYMSPEQSEGMDLGPQSDIFALGLVTYEGLSGSHPFHREGLALTLAAIQSAAMPALESPETRDANPMLRKALAKEVKHRYADASAFATDLRSLAQQWGGDGSLSQLMLDLFGDAISFEKKLLATQDPAELRKMANEQTQSLRLPTSLIEGLASEKGWTDLIDKQDSGGSDRSTRIQMAGMPDPNSSGGDTLRTEWIDPSPQRWITGLAALPLIAGLAWLAMQPSNTERQVPESPGPSPSSLSPTVSKDPAPAPIPDAAPVAAAASRRLDASEPASGPPPVRLRIEGMRSNLPPLPAVLEERGRFTLRADGLLIQAGYRREGDRSLAVSLLSSDPWVVLYRGSGPAVGRLPPARHVTLRLGGKAARLRLRRPGHQDVSLSLRMDSVGIAPTGSAP